MEHFQKYTTQWNLLSATFAHNSKSVKIDDETVAVSFVGKTGKQTFSHGCRAD